MNDEYNVPRECESESFPRLKGADVQIADHSCGFDDELVRQKRSDRSRGRCDGQYRPDRVINN